MMADDPSQSEGHRPALRSYDDAPKKRRRRGAAHLVEGEDGQLKKRYEPDPKKLSEDALREAALRYLDKMDASVEQVRRVLKKRIYRYGDDETRPIATVRIEDLLQRLQESRILDDVRFAHGLAQSQRRRGASLPKVRQKLIAKGLPGELIEQALEALGEDPELSDEASAAEFARKRRLTSKYNLEDPKERQKALAALARQGFSFDIARRVLGL